MLTIGRLAVLLLLMLTTSNSILRSTRPMVRIIAGTVSPSAAWFYAAAGCRSFENGIFGKVQNYIVLLLTF